MFTGKALFALGSIGVFIATAFLSNEINKKQERLEKVLPTLERLQEFQDRWGFAGDETVRWMDLPQEFRVKNYAGGSCVHASIETLLNWQGLYQHASWWRKAYSGGEYSARLNRRLDAANLRYAYTMDKDWSFLQKCIDLRLGCAVNWPSSHMVTLVGMDEQNVYLIDNNSTERIITRSREQFNREWTGWAVTVCYVPPPPKPYR